MPRGTPVQLVGTAVVGQHPIGAHQVGQAHVKPADGKTQPIMARVLGWIGQPKGFQIVKGLVQTDLFQNLNGGNIAAVGQGPAVE